jgi:2-oxoglutarate dehydrogenase E2 component (dihydrolipoamide succinyltransferase)
MPQLGESVTEGTVTRWLKREGERVEADEPLLEVSTDKVDTEIPSPVSGVLRGITVAEDETVAVGAELAVIDEEGAAGGAAPASAGSAPAAEEGTAPAAESTAPAAEATTPAAESAAPAAEDTAPDTQSAPAAGVAYDGAGQAGDAQANQAAPDAGQAQGQGQGQGQPGYNASPYQQPYQPAQPGYGAPPQQYQAPQPPDESGSGQPVPGPEAQPAVYQTTAQPPSGPPGPDGGQQADGAGPQLGSGADGPYVTPLVRKLASEHGIDLGAVSGTGVGGRIRKQDVLDAAQVLRGAPGGAQQAPPEAASPQAAAPQAAAPQAAASQAAAPPSAPPQAAAVQAAPQPAGAAPRQAIVPSNQRGRTEKLSRSRQVIAQRMVESLQTSAQLTTVVEADVTAIARLRDRAKAGFEAREGVKLSYLPFFALAAVEALKVHPKLNAVIDTASSQVTYHDAEHLGIAVDTERGLMVPVIRKAGDLNIAGLARKIADLAERTRAGQVSPDELSGGTFTLTNTGSRGALFDTPIINQPQVGILGTGTVVKRAVVVDDPALGEVITVRSMVYLALTYDHRLVDGADAARFLGTMKTRLEEGAFETELGL